MALSNLTIQKLSDALAPEVADYIMQDSRFFDFLQEIVPDSVSEKLQTSDDDLIFELSMAICDRILVKVMK
jgi:hypothetical protein